MEPGNALGEYLRARRELVSRESAGISHIGRRRVPGLRRDELSLLAGVSTDYYIRLEQGRDRNPSAQVLDALARALQLDDEATAHLHSLGRPELRVRRSGLRPERVPPSIEQLITGWHSTPAFVQGRRLDVLAANRLATALSPLFTPGVSLLPATFLDPGVRDLYGDQWESLAHSTIGHDIRARSTGGTRRMYHPQVGELELHYENLQIAGTEGQTLIVYHADPGSSTAQALLLLATLTADRSEDSAPSHGTGASVRAQSESHHRPG